MRLTFRKSTKKIHQDISSAISWLQNPQNQEEEVYSWSDDTTVSKCNYEGNNCSKVDISTLGSLVLCVDRLSSKSAINTEVILLGCSDGKVYIYSSRFTRLEKVLDAHTGGTLSVKWSKDGSSFVSSGEDGAVKSWSRAGFPRAIIAQTDCPVTSICWTTDSKHVIFASGRTIHVKPIQPNERSNHWKAHDSFITAIGLDQVTGNVVSVSEDGKYKLWDRYGKLLYGSQRFSDSLQSVIWHPNGNYFVVGSYDKLLLCNGTGHLLSSTYLTGSGSVFDFDWNVTATHLACSCGNGDVIIAAVDEIPYQWKQYEVTVYNSTGRIMVKDSVEGIHEELDVKKAVLCTSIGFNHMIVVTSDHIYVYRMKQWNTPLIIDCSKMGQIIDTTQTHGYFAVIDSIFGIQVYSYEGRQVSTIKHPLVIPDCLNRNMVSLSPDGVAVVSSQSSKAILIFDISGRPIGDQPVFTHNRDIQKLSFEQSPFIFGTRLISFLDSSATLYIIPASVASSVTSLGGKQQQQDRPQNTQAKTLSSFVSTFAWDQTGSSICAISDNVFKIWYYPSASIVDEDLMDSISASSADPNSGLTLPAGNWQTSQVLSFTSTMCILYRADGAVGYVSGIKNFPAVLAQLAKNRDWVQTVKLCRFIKSKELWACLAALSLQSQEYDTAEVAYAALEEVKKIRWISSAREDKIPESRQAELSLFRKTPYDSEAILLGSGQLFRCIYTWIELYNWNRALDIAVKYNRYLDVVLYLRVKYLDELGQEENNAKFKQQFQKIETWNEEAILSTLESEKQRLPKY